MRIDRSAREGRTEAALGSLLRGAGVDKDSDILVTGPAGLPALMWFCHHDYKRVGYARSGAAPANDSDCVVVPETCDLAALERLLDQGPRVRRGGVLIVMTPEPKAPSNRATSNRAPSNDDPAHDLLARHGFRIERCLHGARRELHVARRRAA